MEQRFEEAELANYEEISEAEALDPSSLGFKIAGEEEKKEETPEERFKRMVTELVHTRSWSPRKATRYLNSIARRNIKKQIPKRGLKVIRQLFKRYRFEPVNIRQLQKEQEQREFAAQVQSQLDEIEAQKELQLAA